MGVIRDTQKAIRARTAGLDKQPLKMDFIDSEMFDWLNDLYGSDGFEFGMVKIHEMAEELFPIEYDHELLNEMIEVLFDNTN